MRPMPLAKTLERQCIPVPEAGCWLWLGSTTHKGYGRIHKKGRLITAHRAALIARGAVLKPGMMVCHKCDTPSCVNPDHLYIGTLVENTRDRVERGRGWRRSSQTHCKRGHEFTPENTRSYLMSTGYVARYCRTCERARKASQ
jgi:hypothetical protein